MIDSDELRLASAVAKAATEICAALPAPEFMTVEEAAQLLRVNKHTVYDYIKSESPPWARQIGRVLRINRSALLKWFEQGSEQKKGRRRL